jgi:hypothetical protein
MFRRWRVDGGDEAILEEDRNFGERLNPGRGYSNITAWRLVVRLGDASIEPRNPSHVSMWIITLAMTAFFAGMSWFVGNRGRANAQWYIWAVWTFSLLGLWGHTCYEYVRDRRRGAWLRIDAQRKTVSLPRFSVEFPLSQLRLLMILWKPGGAKGGLGPGDSDAASVVNCDLDAVFETDERTIRFSLVGELDWHATVKACERMKELYGIPVSQRTRRMPEEV